MYQHDDQPTVEEDDVLHPLPPPPIFPPPPFVPDNQPRLTYSSMTDLKHLFTIDDAPPSKWHENFFDMYSWCTAACSLPSVGDRSNIILGVPRSNHKEQGKF